MGGTAGGPALQALQCALPRPRGLLTRVLAFGPSPLNRRLCRWCIRSIHKHPGGAEIELSVLFVDVRGSTSIAEELAPGEYSKLLARFYGGHLEIAGLERRTLELRGRDQSLDAWVAVPRVGAPS